MRLRQPSPHPTMLLIYTPHITPRLQYTLQTIFDELLPTTYQLTTNRAAFVGNFVAKLNYSNEVFANTPNILPHGLLATTHTDPIDISVATHSTNVKLLFAQHNTELGFDVFSAIFYLLSRYEEYHSTTPFYDYKLSIAHQQQFLDQPIVHYWCQLLQAHIEQYFPHIEFKTHTYQYIHTYDIDHHHAFKNKPWHLHYLRYTQEYLFNPTQAALRKAVYNQQLLDPWYNFEYLCKCTAAVSEVRFFFHVGNRTTKIDNSLSTHHPDFQSSIYEVLRARNTAIGLHPSYHSNHDAIILKNEKQALEATINTAQPTNKAVNSPHQSAESHKSITTSRQHYLYLQLPETYQRLAAIGIQHDYSMGYSRTVGFRAGVAQSFLWFDIKANATTRLRLHPFMYMDTALHTHLQLSTDAALTTIISLMRNTRKVNGIFVSVWHNSSLGEVFGWQGWQKLHQLAIDSAL